MVSLSKMLDPNVEAVRQKLKQRAEVGLAKYGTDTTRKDIDLIGWIQHLQEELMDATIYCQRLLDDAKNGQQTTKFDKWIISDLSKCPLHKIEEP